MAKVEQASSHQNHQHKSNVSQIDLSKYPVTPIAINEFSLKRVTVILQNNWKSFYGFPKIKISSVFSPPTFIVF